MPPNDNTGSEFSATARLDGWKEIAGYLKRSVRTAQRWERELKLPVRRIQTVKGETVFAFPQELDGWLLSRDLSTEADADEALNTEPSIQQSPEPERPPTESPAPTQPPANVRSLSLSRSQLLRWAVVVIVLAFIGAMLSSGRLRKKEPANVHIEQSAIVAVDAENRELWRHNFSDPILLSNPALPPKYWIGDLDGDGHTEILFAHEAADLPRQESILYCFSHDGKQLWQFSAGHTVRTATEVFNPPFLVRDFVVIPSSYGNLIAVSSVHATFYPDQVAILDPHGRLLREYWHSGHIQNLALKKGTGDTKPMLYASGVNNEYRVATLVALDPEQLGGTSAQTDPRYQLLDMPIAHEAGRVYFPRSCISRVSQPYNFAKVEIVSSGEIRVSTREQFDEAYYAGVNYVLTPDLKLISAYIPDAYIAQHSKLRTQKLLDHAYTPRELEVLIARFHDQQSFLKVHGPEGVH